MIGGYMKISLSLFIEVFEDTFSIVIFVFIIMILVDYVNVLSRDRLTTYLSTSRSRQYILTSLFGSTPGCLGAFLNVSLYVHGIISLGAIVGGMIATSGDEAFIMLSLFPGKALVLFFILFILGIVLGMLTDAIAPKLNIQPGMECPLLEVHPKDLKPVYSIRTISEIWKTPSMIRFMYLIIFALLLANFVFGIFGAEQWDWRRISIVILLFVISMILGTVPEHYLREHITGHLLKKHLVRIMIIAFLALLIVKILTLSVELRPYIQNNIWLVFLGGVLLGVLPTSGPHLIVVFLFAEGLIPFSILLASSIVQDGDGMIPMVSYSLRDSIVIKMFNLIFGVIIGGLALLMGY
jgi:hypothetical protein